MSGPVGSSIAMHYAGIGSRETPDDVLHLMELMAIVLRADGWSLRSGGATGADAAFASGAGSDSTIYLPWAGYRKLSGPGTVVLTGDRRAQAEKIASEMHPAWDRCGIGARGLHSRNVAIIRGDTLNDPAAAVICWTPGGRLTGGTAMGIRIAQADGIPVFNMATERTEDILAEMCLIKAATRDTVDA